MPTPTFREYMLPGMMEVRMPTTSTNPPCCARAPVPPIFSDQTPICHAWLLDAGGTSVYDPQMLWLWSADEWREEAARRGLLNLRHALVNERLAAEAGIHGHHEHEIDVGENLFDRAGRIATSKRSSTPAQRACSSTSKGRTICIARCNGSSNSA